MAGKPVLSIGLVTDIHYADADTRGTRYYRESLTKLQEAAMSFREQQVDLAIELGDLIDTLPRPQVEAELRFLRTINDAFRYAARERHYVLGNHCVATLTKQQFFSTVRHHRKPQPALARPSWYSWDRRGVHLIVLDACFRKDGVAYGEGRFTWTDTNICPTQLAWLSADLARAQGPVLVFVHQRLDLPDTHVYSIRQARQIREILEASGKVRAVLMGHSHGNEYNRIKGIHYLTLAAMVEGSGPENNGYSKLTICADGSLHLTGFRRHAEHPAAAALLT